MRKFTMALAGAALALISARAEALSIVGIQFLGSGSTGAGTPWTVTGAGFTTDRVYWNLSTYSHPGGTPNSHPIYFSRFLVTADAPIAGTTITGCYEAFGGPCGSFGNDPFPGTAVIGGGVEYSGGFGYNASINVIPSVDSAYQAIIEMSVASMNSGSSRSVVATNVEVCFVNGTNCVGQRIGGSLSNPNTFNNPITPPPGGAAVPAPAAIGLLGLGLVGLATRIRR